MDDETTVTISDDQFEKLATVITSRITEKLAGTEGAPAPKIEEPPEPVAKTDEPSVPLDAKVIASAVMEMLQSQQNADAGKVYNTLFDERYQSTIRENPGLGEYMDGTDDYGNVRKDQLMKMESYDDRIKTFDSLGKAYSEAMAGQPGRAPVVNTKAREKAKEHQTNFDEANGKLDRGEYTSEADFAKDFMNAISAEMGEFA